MFSCCKSKVFTSNGCTDFQCIFNDASMNFSLGRGSAELLSERRTFRAAPLCIFAPYVAIQSLLSFFVSLALTLLRRTSTERDPSSSSRNAPLQTVYASVTRCLCTTFELKIRLVLLFLISKLPLVPQLWSFGCRTVRTRRILRSARARQSCYMLRFLFPALFDCIFGDGYLASRGRNEVRKEEFLRHGIM